jgi:hypothetical protein
MRRRTRSEPDCSGRCRCGQTLGVSAIACRTSSVKSRGCGEVNRTRSSPVDGAELAQQLGELRCAGEVTAVGVDVLAQQRDLEHVVGDERLDLLDDLADPAGAFGAAQARDDAEGAGVVAPDGDRHPGVVADVALRRQSRGEGLELFDQLDDGDGRRVGLREQLRQVGQVVGAVDDVDPRRLVGHDGAVLLGEAAPDHDGEVLPARPALILERLEVAERAVEPVVGVLADRTGVE